ncbi:MAG TPA: glycerol-3-phosphate 1-O-acyltransferase PlsY [Dokdonella sp.]|uniref:glycerol-3-phosphate 1-O-acyltransferase PlsY n=1 Tax=Dokdonella sp. TaxID=2291710 RepID=UPI0025BD1B96|nr:glycerol-3-phosphate 1-O-acyltransferase PlsY [Dokdonella sp.]MBX3691041.1 glycerol-3-phosphate 1-O-acyltransferase PlsY [Dokdonella sp.]MCW5567561.1 glycerol-3-phosphate 1-O-acyltransferase PlsY [Dokdonella sp.]HNR92336.1 glycerol-3-phosphate 1-O-acyltransferase PlsY [Dokdonella sp.]
MLIVLAKLVASWLLGSISGSLVLGRWRGVDIRDHGSGNAGGTNALRVAGWKFALGVVVIDIGKGALAAWIGLDEVAAARIGVDAIALGAGCAFAAVIGHCWPVYFGFRGGKGAGTAVGGVLVLAPVFVLPMLTVWLAIVFATRFVGLATVLAALAFPLCVWLAGVAGWQPPPALLVFALAVAVLIVFTHRANLRRLWRGEEPRIGRSRA